MIVSNRHEFLGAHVTPSVKKRLRERATKQGISVSRLVYRILLRALKLPDEEYV